MDLTSGLYLSIGIAIVTAAICSLIYADRSLSEWTDVDELVILLGVAVSAGGSTFCFVLPIANVAVNMVDGELGSLAEMARVLREEFANGVLALRISSIHVGIQALLSLSAAMKLEPIPITNQEKDRLDRFPEQQSLLPDIELPTYRNRLAQLFLNIIQCGVYELAVIVLWMLDSQAKRPLTSIALSWVLFYIVDDWRIIFRYSTAVRGRILPTHRRQIWAANVVITALAAGAAYQIGVWALVVFLVFSYLLLRLLLLLMNGVEGGMIVVDALNWKDFKARKQRSGPPKISGLGADVEPDARPKTK